MTTEQVVEFLCTSQVHYIGYANMVSLLYNKLILHADFILNFVPKAITCGELSHVNQLRKVTVSGMHCSIALYIIFMCSYDIRVK